MKGGGERGKRKGGKRRGEIVSGEECEECANESVGNVISAKNTVIALFRRVMTSDNGKKTEEEKWESQARRGCVLP